MPAPPAEVWDTLLDPDKLAKVIPGCKALEKTGEDAYAADVNIGVGPVRGLFHATVSLSNLQPPASARLSGSLSGPLGASSGGGDVTLTETDGGTTVAYAYEVHISGKVAAVGGRMLNGAARTLISQFFKALVKQAGGGKNGGRRGKTK